MFYAPKEEDTNCLVSHVGLSSHVQNTTPECRIFLMAQLHHSINNQRKRHWRGNLEGQVLFCSVWRKRPGQEGSGGQFCGNGLEGLFWRKGDGGQKWDKIHIFRLRITDLEGTGKTTDEMDGRSHGLSPADPSISVSRVELPCHDSSTPASSCLAPPPLSQELNAH
ncbi:uncharacterized protein CLUP02_03693 [Colletotrichum lupini]|uniref:Uncharacterized protein n=1 Tax=Colletotrichum lupini TaxID=145971 RepID=A0A9Q8WCZ4_9PEZI|nr:uncharacterized protein CLUP02_03693 [Colletotrichum lupini]UQC78217.1 hypothetical protein CLUP02_03693 [Colletotrichum lupini]